MAQVRDEPFTTPYAAKGQTARAGRRRRSSHAGLRRHDHLQHPARSGRHDRRHHLQRRAAPRRCRDLEQSFGAESYFDADGDFVFAAKTRRRRASVWTVDAGETGVMVDARREPRPDRHLQRRPGHRAARRQPAADHRAGHLRRPDSARSAGAARSARCCCSPTRACHRRNARPLPPPQSLLGLRLKTDPLARPSAPHRTPRSRPATRSPSRSPTAAQETHLIDAVQIEPGHRRAADHHAHPRRPDRADRRPLVLRPASMDRGA